MAPRAQVVDPELQSSLFDGQEEQKAQSSQNNQNDTNRGQASTPQREGYSSEPCACYYCSMGRTDLCVDK